MRSWVIISLGLFALIPIPAQTLLGAGALGGTIRDESGAVVADAKVSLTEESKDLIRESKSDRGGSFLFPAIIAGMYSIAVEKPGFSPERINGLKIDIGEHASLVITLRLAAVRTEITVQAPTTIELDAESNSRGSVVDSERVRELPLNGRNLLDLAGLAAGAVDLNLPAYQFSNNVGLPERTIVLPGTLPNSVSYALNGINITGSRDGELALSPSVEAVDQFKVQQSFLMPDQGMNAASVNIVTKSGTNKFHGDAFEFLRNGSLDARSFFATSPEDLKRNQFGVAFGGPIRKNRVWFHGFYEGVRELTAFSTAGYNPTAQMFTGNFTGTGHIIYDPASLDPSSGIRQEFPGNVIPLTRLNQVAQNLLPYYLPGSSLSSIPSNIRGNPRNTVNDDQGGLRVDAALNAQHQLFGQIFQQNTPSDLPRLNPFSGMLYQNNSVLTMLQEVWTVSPQAVNTLRLGFLRNLATGGNEAQGQGPLLASIGIANTFDQNGISAINLQGYSSFGRANGVVGNHDNTWQLDEEFNYSRGRHHFAFGAGLRYRRGWHQNGNGNALGSLSFQPAFTAQLTSNAQGQRVPLANTGDSFADFLLGYPVTGTLVGFPLVQYRATEVTPFFQDSWELTSNLTMNYGIFWYLDPPPEPQGSARGLVHGFDTQTGLLTFAVLGQMSHHPVHTDKNNFAPRLGLAWKPDFLRNTVIRAGAGIYYSQFAWFWAPYPLIGSPVGAGTSFTNALANPQPTYVMGMNIFPPTASGGITQNYAANLPRGMVATALNPNFPTAYVGQWNFALEHSLSRNDSVGMDYLGSSGHQLPNVNDISQCQPTASLFCGAKTYPQYGALLYTQAGGNSSYEALIATYEHRTSYGLNLRFEYALAKAIADTFQFTFAANNQISDCRACAKGPATFDVRQRAVGSIVWTAPFGRGYRYGGNLPRWADIAAGGWTLTAITTFSTGQPIQLAAPNQTGSAFITPLPNRVCDGRSSQLSGNIRQNGFLWFNTSCFSVPPVGYFGNSGPTVINGPGINNWDIGVEKSFVLVREATRLQLRAEMFNAWNHAQFGQPNGNAGAGPNFGRISSSLPPRLIQVAAKVYW
jgi:hypothetical protein